MAKELDRKKVGKVVKKAKKKENALTISIYDLDGKIEKEIELPKEIFSVKVSPRLLTQYVRVYLANQRQGTASTKTRGEVSGSTRKIYRQKGTGRARHGDIKAPIFVGGGIVGGPRPKDFRLKIGRKQKKKALLGALTLKQESKELIGLSDKFLSVKPKTKLLIEFFQKLNLEKEKKLLVIPLLEKNQLLLAVRNIPTVIVVSATALNCYQLLNHKKILFIAKTIEVIKNINKDEN